ncbi:uncharacterized protein FYW47_002993 [Aplochiton taeniatus]
MSPPLTVLLFSLQVWMLTAQEHTPDQEWKECPHYSFDGGDECYFDRTHTIIWTPYKIQLRSMDEALVYDILTFNVEDIGKPAGGPGFYLIFISIPKDKLAELTSIQGGPLDLRPELCSSDPWVEFIELDMEEPPERLSDLNTLMTCSPSSDCPRSVKDGPKRIYEPK